MVFDIFCISKSKAGWPIFGYKNRKKYQLNVRWFTVLDDLIFLTIDKHEISKISGTIDKSGPIKKNYLLQFL